MSPAAKGTAKPRQRPGTAVLDKGRQSAAAVLDAAAALLVEEGAAGLSTRKVAARAGMHAGNVQYYFRTKQDLVRALLERCIGEGRERVGARLESARGSAKEKLLGAIEEILADQCSPEGCALFREVWALAAHDEEVAAVVRGFYRDYIAEVATVLRQASPRLGAAAATRVATLVVAMLEGLSVVEDAPARRPADKRRLAGEIAGVAMAMAGTG